MRKLQTFSFHKKHRFQVGFDASNLTSGVCIYTINAKGFAQSKKNAADEIVTFVGSGLSSLDSLCLALHARLFLLNLCIWNYIFDM